MEWSSPSYILVHIQPLLEKCICGIAHVNHLLKCKNKVLGMEKLLKGWGNSVGKGHSVSPGILSSQGVANVTTVTFNYILVIVFLFPLNVGVRPCFHCTVLVTVYKVHTSCFNDTVVSSCYRFHTFFCMMQVLQFLKVSLELSLQTTYYMLVTQIVPVKQNLHMLQIFFRITSWKKQSFDFSLIQLNEELALACNSCTGGNY